MNLDPRGTIVQQGNIMRIDNAFVEEVFCFTNSSSYILISYAEPEANGITSIQTLRLNINRRTIILNTSGQTMCPCCIQEGMWVNTIFSPRMTRSIPPQSNAFLILVQRRPQPLSSVTTDRIAFLDPDNRFLYTGNPNDVNSQTRFVVTDTTSITNRMGRQIRFDALRPGQMVRITHANFMTASIPPQTTAFQIQRL